MEKEYDEESPKTDPAEGEDNTDDGDVGNAGLVKDRFLANASRRFSTEGRRGFGATPGGVVDEDEDKGDLGDFWGSKLYFLCCSALPRILEGRHPWSSNDRLAL